MGKTSTEWHRITRPDANAKVGDCSKCGINVPIVVLSNGYFACRTVTRAGQYRSNRHTGHGLTMAEAQTYTQLVGACEICGKDTGRLYVDHDHDTGGLRGVLCNRCNTRIPILEDPEWLALALEYLAYWRERG